MTTNGKEVLRVENLTRSFGDLVAVNDLSFSLMEGDIFGFIGPNGAGKTTTIRMLATLLEPDKGEAGLYGVDLFRDPEGARKYLGYMPDIYGIYGDLTVWEYVDFFAAAYGVERHRRAKLVEDSLYLTDLLHKKDHFTRALSKGMKQRLCLAKTLSHDPSFLLLDEPASGLDPRARIEMRELLKELTKMGKTIMISSHILPELAELCNKIGIIEAGNLLAFGTVEEIMHRMLPKTILSIKVSSDPEEAVEVLKKLKTIGDANIVDSGIEAEYIGEEGRTDEIIFQLVTQGVRVRSLNEITADLEDVFMKITKGEVQ